MDEHQYGYVASFERNFNHTLSSQLISNIWTYSLGFSAIYIVLVISGQNYMRSRSRYDLRIALSLWSSSLALFSIIGAIRTLPEFWAILTKQGLEYTVCQPKFFYGVSGFWSFLFTLSKVIELGDTAFIVLRKQPLQFLHVYHHVTVLIYTWYSYAGLTAHAQWFTVMNFCVHAAMYSYYALRALRVRLAPSVGVFITTMQLTQMLVGCTINTLAYRIKIRGEYCNPTYANINYSFLMYLSYFLLFINFFYQKYLKKDKKLS